MFTNKNQYIKTVIKIILFIFTYVVIIGWTYQLHDSPQVGIDDANIFFTYAENLASGKGIIYAHNSERVEGFTSMLWMLICALSFFINLNESGILFISIAFLLFTQIIFLNIIYQVASSKNQKAWPYQCIYTALILCSPSYITWMTITLMDTCLWGCIIAVITYIAVFPPNSTRNQFLSTIPFVLISMVRPESMIVAPMFLVLAWLQIYTQTKSPYNATRFIVINGSFFVISVIILTMFRLWYFGYPFPNTYYAKVSPSMTYNVKIGGEYLYNFAQSGTIIQISLLMVLSSVASWLGKLIDKIFITHSFNISFYKYELLSLITFTLLFIPVFAGGDHFRMFRFYQPIYPLMCLTVVVLISELKIIQFDTFSNYVEQRPIQIAAITIVLGYWLYGYSFDVSWSSMKLQSPLIEEFRRPKNGINNGKKLQLLFNNSFPSVGVISAGGIARTYPGEIVDLMGLNNITMAHATSNRVGIKNHAAFNKECFYLAQPDILLVTPPEPPLTSNFTTIVLQDLINEPRFVAQWHYGILTTQKDSEYNFTGFFKVTFLDTLLLNTQYQFVETKIWSNNGWANLPKNKTN